MTAAPDMVAAALEVAAGGWPVFPCNPQAGPGGKRPLTPKESAPGAKDGGLYLATCNPDQIKEWWSRWPKALIGVPTGGPAGGFVLDLDAKAFDAGAMADAVAQFCGDEALDGPCAQTQGRGRHYWFAMPDLATGEKLGNRANLFKDVAGVSEAIAAHVDVRGEGGYVICPPSVMSDGKAYRWLVPPGGSLPQAPAKLVDVILRCGDFARGSPGLIGNVSGAAGAQQEARKAPRASSTASPRTGSGLTGNVKNSALRKYALSALDAEIENLATMGSGGRNHGLNIAAVKLGGLVGAGALDESVVRAALAGAADRNGLLREDGPRSINATIESGIRKGMSEPRDLTDIERKAEARAGRAPSPPPRTDIPDNVYEFDAARSGFDPSRSAVPASSPLPVAAAGGANFSSRLGESVDLGENSNSDSDGGVGETTPALGDAPDDIALARRPLTDLGNVERFLVRFGGDFRWCHTLGWLAWDGRRWNADLAEGAARRSIDITIRAIKGEAKAIAGTDDDIAITKGNKTVLWSEMVFAWAKTSQSAGHVRCLLPMIAHYLEVPHSALDADPYRINVENGTLVAARCDDGDYIVFQPHDKADMITKIAPVRYDPDAKCSGYDRFLARVQPDPGMRRFLHGWGGLSLTGDAGEHKLVFFYGKGRNGKSTLIDTWAHVAGDYADTVPIETFVDQGKARKGADASPDLAGLAGVRLLRTSEPEKRAKLAESMIKAVTGGEPIKVRHLNRDFFDLRPQFKLTISGNYKPEITGTDDGIWGRVVLVPWMVKIPDEDQDLHLTRKLRAEASGILNRLLDGLRDWLDVGIEAMKPGQVVEATDEYRSDSDPLGRFLAHCVEDDAGARVQSSELHKVFCAWAKASGEREWTATGFGKAMRERGYKKKQSNFIYWLGLKLIRSVSEFEPQGHAGGGYDGGGDGARGPPIDA